MVGKNNWQLRREKEANTITRYTIKKLSFGAASVAIGAFLLFGQAPRALAAEEAKAAAQAEVEEASSTTDEEAWQAEVAALLADLQGDMTPKASETAGEAEAEDAPETSADVEEEPTSHEEEATSNEEEADSKEAETVDRLAGAELATVQPAETPAPRVEKLAGPERSLRKLAVLKDTATVSQAAKEAAVLEEILGERAYLATPKKVTAATEADTIIRPKNKAERREAADTLAAEVESDKTFNNDVPFLDETFGEIELKPGTPRPIKNSVLEYDGVEQDGHVIKLKMTIFPREGAAQLWGTTPNAEKYAGHYVISFNHPDFYENIASIDTEQANGPAGETKWKKNNSGRDWLMELNNANLGAGVIGSPHNFNIKITLKDQKTLGSLGLSETPLSFTAGMVAGKGAKNDYNKVVNGTLINGWIQEKNPNNPDLKDGNYAPHRVAGAVGDNRFADGLFTDKGVSQQVYYDENLHAIVSRHTFTPPQNFLQSNYNWLLYVKERIPKALLPYIDRDNILLGAMNDEKNPYRWSTSIGGSITPQKLTIDENGLVDSSRNPNISITQTDNLSRKEQIAALGKAQGVLNDNVFEGTLGQPRTYTIVYPLIAGKSKADIGRELAKIAEKQNQQLLFESWLESDFVNTPQGALNGATPYADNGQAHQRLQGSYANSFFDAKYELAMSQLYEPTVAPEEIHAGQAIDLTNNVTGYVDEAGQAYTFKPGEEPNIEDVTEEAKLAGDDSYGYDNTTPGTYKGAIKVTYADGTVDVVDVLITVTEAPQEQSSPPKIDALTAGEDVVTGAGVAGATIILTTPAGQQMETTVDQNGRWAVPLKEPLVEADLVKVAQVEAGKQESKTVTAKAAPQEESAKPAFDLPQDGDKDITGTGIEGATITVTNAQGEQQTATVVKGHWRVTFDEPVKAGESLQATQTEVGKKASAQATTTVDAAKVQNQSAQPTLDPLKAGATSVSGHGVPSAEVVTVILPGGEEKKTTVNADGTWRVDLDQPLEEGQMIKATQTEAGEAPSDPAIGTVAPQAVSVKPGVNPPSAGDTDLIGTGVAGATIEATVGNQTKTATVRKDGRWALTFNEPMQEGEAIRITQTETGKKESAATESTVTKAALLNQSTQPTLNRPLEGEQELNGTGVPGATITVTLPDGQTKDVTVQDDKTWTLTLDTPLVAEAKISATQTEKGERASEPITQKVKAQEVSAKPGLDTPDENDTFVNGTGVPGATITLTDSKNKTFTTTVGADGYWRVRVEDPFAVGDTIHAVQSEAGKKPSGEAEATAQAVTLANESAAPEIHPLMEGATAITGSGIAGATIKLQGTDLTTTVDAEGNWSLTVPEALQAADTVTVTQTQKGERESQAVTASVKAQPVSQAPAINSAQAGDTTVSGSGVPGASIQLEAAGQTYTTTVDEAGKWSVDVAPLTVGDLLTATQQGEGKKVSAATESTVVSQRKQNTSATPTLTTPEENSDIVSGQGVPGATITVTAPDGSTQTVTVNADSYWAARLPKALQVGDEVEISQTEPGEKASPVVAATAIAQPQAGVPGFDTPKAGDKTISGTGQVGAKVTVTDDEGNTYTDWVDAQGNWAIQVKQPVKAGQELTARQSVPGQKDSELARVQVQATAVQNDSAQPTIDPLKAGDTTVAGHGIAGSQVIVVTLPDGKTVETTVDENNRWSITLDKPLEADQTVKATQTEMGAKPSEAVSRTVEGLEKSPQPGLNTPEVGNRFVSGSGTPGAKIVVTDPQGETYEATVDETGTWLVLLDEALTEVGQKLTATQEIAGLAPSDTAETTVQAQTLQGESSQPTIDPLEAGDTTISGTGIAGSEISTVIVQTDGETYTAKVDENGRWRLTLPEGVSLAAGQAVSDTQTEPGKKVSEATETTVQAKAVSAVPGLNAVDNGDTKITGTGLPGASITVSAPGQDPVTVVVDADSKWTAVLPKAVETDQVITARQTEDDKEASPLATTTVQAAELNTSAQPTIDPITAGDTKISGQGVPNAEVITVILPDSEQKTATVDANGHWEVQLDTPLVEGESVAATQTEVGAKPSDATTAEVKAQELSTEPSVKRPTAGEESLTGSGLAGATITITNAQGEQLGETTVDQDGNWQVDLGQPIAVGDTFTVTQTEDGKQPSAPVTTDAKDAAKATSAVPVVKPIAAGATTVSGTGVVGATITVEDPDGNSHTTKVSADGTWQVDLGQAAQAGTTLTVSQQEDGKNRSNELTVTVQEADKEEESAEPTVEDVKAGDKVVSGKGQAGATITVKDPDGNTYTTTVDQDGNWSVDLPEVKQGEELTITQQKEGKEPASTTVTVQEADKEEESAKPTVDDIKAGDKVVSGKGQAGATITVKDPDGNTYTTTVDQDGNWSVDLPEVKQGEELTITQTEDGKAPTSISTTVQESDKEEESAEPTVEDVKAGDKTVSGKGEVGATITVTDQNGKTHTTTVDKDGDWKIDLPNAVEKGDTLTITQQEEGKEPTSISATVQESDKEEESAKPSVKPIKPGDTTISGTGQAGADIAIVDGTGQIDTGQVDAQGQWTITLPKPVEPGDHLSITQTEHGKKPSSAVKITIPGVLPDDGDQGGSSNHPGSGENKPTDQPGAGENAGQKPGSGNGALGATDATDNSAPEASTADTLPQTSATDANAAISVSLGLALMGIGGAIFHLKGRKES